MNRPNEKHNMGAALDRLITSFRVYCEAFEAHEGRVIGEDGYADEAAQKIAQGLNLLLSCERGKFDGATQSRAINYICNRHGIEI